MSNSPESAELSYTKCGDKHGQVALDSRVAVTGIRGVELVRIADPLQMLVLLDVVQAGIRTVSILSGYKSR